MGSTLCKSNLNPQVKDIGKNRPHDTCVHFQASQETIDYPEENVLFYNNPSLFEEKMLMIDNLIKENTKMRDEYDQKLKKARLNNNLKEDQKELEKKITNVEDFLAKLIKASEHMKNESIQLLYEKLNEIEIEIQTVIAGFEKSKRESVQVNSAASSKTLKELYCDYDVNRYETLETEIKSLKIKANDMKNKMKEENPSETEFDTVVDEFLEKLNEEEKNLEKKWKKYQTDMSDILEKNTHRFQQIMLDKYNKLVDQITVVPDDQCWDIQQKLMLCNNMLRDLKLENITGEKALLLAQKIHHKIECLKNKLERLKQSK